MRSPMTSVAATTVPSGSPSARASRQHHVAELLDRYKQGDDKPESVPNAIAPAAQAARANVCRISGARGLDDTQDLVQDAIVRAYVPRSIEATPAIRALQAYGAGRPLPITSATRSRKVNNAAARRNAELEDEHADNGAVASPQAAPHREGRPWNDTRRVFERCVRPIAKPLIVARLELQQSYEV